MGSTDFKINGSNESIKLVSANGELLGTIFLNVDDITFMIDVGT